MNLYNSLIDVLEDHLNFLQRLDGLNVNDALKVVKDRVKFLVCVFFKTRNSEILDEIYTLLNELTSFQLFLYAQK